MDEALKQRLIGALVLLALGVIFLPVLFEPDHRRDLEQNTRIPPAPEVVPFTIDSPGFDADVAAAKPAQEMYAIAEESDIAEAAEASESAPEGEQPLLDKVGVVRAWAVQVGSFSEADRAAQLTDRLLEKGYPAYARVSNAGSGEMTRVYVGPKVQRSKVVKLKRELDGVLGTETLIVVFNP